MSGTGKNRQTLKFTRPAAPAPSLRMGATTQQFFIEGAQHEATQWEHAHLPPDDVAEDNALGFTSFDEIPRKRGPLLSLLAIGVFLIIGSVAWAMSLNRMAGGRAVKDWLVSRFPSAAHFVARVSLAKPVSAPPRAAPVAGSPEMPVATSPRPSLPGAVSPAEVAPSMGPPVRAPVAPAIASSPAAPSPASLAPPRAALAPAISPAPPGSATTPISKHAGQASPRFENAAPSLGVAPDDGPPINQDSEARSGAKAGSEPARRSHALKGYVWSPEAGGLVPAHPNVDETVSKYPQ